jgi:hypothetical protein
MSARSESLGGYLILLSLFAFAYGGSCIYTARRASALAHNEGTTFGIVSVHESKKPDLFAFLQCDYAFWVNGTYYRGHGICPEQTDHSVTGTLQNLAGMLQQTSVTIYYDPADPVFNSMMEFGAKSVYDYRKAKLSFLAGAALLIFTVVGALYFGIANKANPGIVVDFKGTVIYPDQIDSKEQE